MGEAQGSRCLCRPSQAEGLGGGKTHVADDGLCLSLGVEIMKPLPIEDGIPIPTIQEVLAQPRTRAGLTASLLEVGQSTVCETQSEFNTIRRYLSGKKRKCRSIKTASGWRIWRVT